MLYWSTRKNVKIVKMQKKLTFKVPNVKTVKMQKYKKKQKKQ